MSSYQLREEILEPFEETKKVFNIYNFKGINESIK